MQFNFKFRHILTFVSHKAARACLFV